MDLLSKRVLFIDLERRLSEVKTFPDYKKYIGGLCLGLKIYEQYVNQDPVIFAIGPLNGLFPFISKTAVILKSKKIVQDIYLGGHFSTRLKFSNLDAIVFYGKAKNHTILDISTEGVTFYDENTQIDKLGLPGKKSALFVTENAVLIDQYFGEPQNMLLKKLQNKKIKGIVITGTNILVPPQMNKYEEIYTKLLERTQEITVKKAFFPACSGCPMGCERSKEGESGGNIILHSLVACEFAEKIYTDIGTIFSCLNSVGYDYTHEDIEAIPHLVKNTLGELKK